MKEQMKFKELLQLQHLIGKPPKSDAAAAVAKKKKGPLQDLERI